MTIYVKYPSNRSYKLIVQILGLTPNLYWQEGHFGKHLVCLLDDEYRKVIAQWPSYAAPLKIKHDVNIESLIPVRTILGEHNEHIRQDIE